MSDADVEYGLLDGPRQTGAEIDDFGEFYAEPSQYEYIRPPWQTKWRRFLHLVGMCRKERGGYRCHARTRHECP